MAGNQNLVAKIIINAQDNASKVFQSIQDKAGTLAAALVTYFSAVFFKGAVDSAADFELQLDKVAAKGGYTAIQMEKLKNAAFEIGAKFGVSGTQAAEGLEILAAAGLKSSEAINTLPSVLGLAKSEAVSMDVAATKITDTLSIMGLGFNNAGRAADVLTKAANLSNTSAVGVADSIKYAGGIAKASGYSFEQAAAMIDVLANSGLKGEQAGTGLRSVLTSLKDPSSTASKELDKLGISTRDVGAVMDALKSKGKDANAAILGFGQEGAPAVYAFMEQGSAKIKEFTKELQNAGGASKETSDAMSSNFEGAKTRLSAAFDNLKIQLGTPILKPLTDSFDGLVAQFQHLQADGTIDKVGQSLADVFKAGGEWAVEFVKKTDFTAIGENIKTFATNVSLTFQEIGDKARTAGDVVNLVTGVFSAGFNTIQAAAGILEAVVTATFGGMNQMLGQVATGWGEIFSLVPGFGSVGESLKSVGSYMTQSGDAALKFAASLKDEAAKQMQEAGVAADKVQTAFKNLGDSASDSVPKLDKIWGVSEKLRETLGGIESKEISITADSRDAQNKVDNLKKPTEHTHTVIPDTRNAEHAKANLTTPTFSTHYVNVSYIDNGNGTANVGGRTVYHPTGSNYWGDRPQGYSIGGAIDFKRREGKLGGYGGGDTVPAMLEPGEFIMRKEAVAMYGTDFMAQINNTKVDSTLPAVKIPRGDDDVLLPIQKFQFGGLVNWWNEPIGSADRLKGALDSAKATEQMAQRELDFVQNDYNDMMSKGRSNPAYSVSQAQKINELNANVQAQKDKVTQAQKAYDDAVKKDSEQQKAFDEQRKAQEKIDATVEEQARVEPEKITKPNIPVLPKTQPVQNVPVFEKQTTAPVPVISTPQIPDLYPYRRSVTLEEATANENEKNTEKLTQEKQREADKQAAETEKLAQEKQRLAEKQAADLYKQKEEGFKLAGDDVGLENLRYEKEKQDLAGNKEALAQAEKNHQAKLAQIEAEKQDKLKKEQDKIAEEKQREAEKLAQEKQREAEKKAAEAEKTQQEKISRFKEFEQKVKAQQQEITKKREQSKQAELEQRLESARLDGNEIEAEKIRYQQELSKIDQYDYRAGFLLKENHEKRLAQIRKEQSSVATQTTQLNRAESFTAQETQKTTPTQSNQVITIRFELPSSGKTAQGQFSQNDANAVVEILRNAAASGLPASFIR